MQTCTSNNATSSTNNKKKPKTYKSALREEMAKTFGKFIGQEREQKVAGNACNKIGLTIDTKSKFTGPNIEPYTASSIPSNNFFQTIPDNTPLTAKTSFNGSFNQSMFDRLSPTTPKQEANLFQYTTFSEDDEEYCKPIEDLNEFITKFISQKDDEEEYDDGDGFARITTKRKPFDLLTCYPSDPFSFDSVLSQSSQSNSQPSSQLDSVERMSNCMEDEPPTPKIKPQLSAFDFTCAPTSVSSSIFSDDVEMDDHSPKSNSSSSTITPSSSKSLPKKASVDIFAKPIEYDRLDDEFQSLKKFETRLQRKSGMHVSGYRQHNLAKNRYKNILPNEFSRVLLKCRERNEPGSDYINANHIKTQSTQKFKNIELSPPPSYIATQAPLPSTFGDFWRMIVEHNSTIIIMLSNEVVASSDSESDGESKDVIDQFDQCFNKNKVNKYWPSIKEKRVYDEVTVETIEEQVTPYDFIYRKFVVFHESISHHGRAVHFFQYTGWPDMGVPTNTSAFFKLIDYVDNLMRNSDTPCGPITIHCSAGVGRTGTFCTIHILLSQYKEYLSKSQEERERDVKFDFNIYNIVKQLKNMRVGMVQRKEQYRFCYTALREGINQIHKEMF